ncbi:type II toxin-antitoxin system RelE/ParE family toxin [Hymenobacter coccineus]|uniref:Addiction module toxin RelE n=1 Tax=Hymenobacter coccineus TaxID=1908235 RepID=A0A1G1TMT9_9BACT|nr:type II toxin-antitoxin system RelE/ParE family toxin [Hymenobacter coccineus]OGX92186.1 hypothetical protein BEN49_16920 [Hymenobacter coccineus]
MSCQIKTLDCFDRQAKRLARKHSSLSNDLGQLVAALRIDPTQGTSLGHGCYKIRLRIASKDKGKSGGVRVITCVVSVAAEVYLLSIYDKSEQASISDAELLALASEIPTINS